MKIFIPNPKSGIIVEIAGMPFAGLIRINPARYGRDGNIGDGLGDDALGTDLADFFSQLSILLLKMLRTVDGVLPLGREFNKILLFRKDKFEVRYGTNVIIMSLRYYKIIYYSVNLKAT